MIWRRQGLAGRHTTHVTGRERQIGGRGARRAPLRAIEDGGGGGATPPRRSRAPTGLPSVPTTPSRSLPRQSVGAVFAPVSRVLARVVFFLCALHAPVYFGAASWRGGAGRAKGRPGGAAAGGGLSGALRPLCAGMFAGRRSPQGGLAACWSGERSRIFSEGFLAVTASSALSGLAGRLWPCNSELIRACAWFSRHLCGSKAWLGAFVCETCKFQVYMASACPIGRRIGEPAVVGHACDAGWCQSVETSVQNSGQPACHKQVTRATKTRALGAPAAA